MKFDHVRGATAVAFGVLSLLTAVQSALAAPLQIVESVALQFAKYDPTAGPYQPPKVFSLDTGVNSITGSVTGIFFVTDDPAYPEGYLSNADDLLKVIVPDGKQITSASMSVSNYVDAGTGTNQRLSVRVGGASGDAGGVMSTSFPLGLQTTNPLTSYTSGSGPLAGGPLGAGTHTIDIGGLIRPSLNTVRADYVLSLTVTAVPEPGTVAFVGIGAAVILIRRRPRCRNLAVGRGRS